MKKQWLSIVLVLCMVLCMAPATALAAEDETGTLKITVDLSGLYDGVDAGGKTFSFEILRKYATYGHYKNADITIASGKTEGTVDVPVEEGKYVVKQISHATIDGYDWENASHQPGTIAESTEQEVFAGKTKSVTVHNFYKIAVTKEITELPIEIDGYALNAKAGDIKASTDQMRVDIHKVTIKQRNASGGWDDLASDATIQANTQYAVEIFVNAKPEYTYTGLTKDKVTVNGETASEFENPSTQPGVDMRVFHELEVLQVVKTVKSIEITTPPTKTEYMAGEDFDPTGMVVTAHYTDGTTADLSRDKYVIFYGDQLTQGQTDVTIQYNDGSGSSNIKTYQAITVKPYVGPHTHTYGGPWYADAKSHWHQCTDSACPDPSGSTKDLASHTFVWKVDKAATETQTGLKHEECTVCSYKRSENTVIDKLPATHSHSYGTEWKYDDTNHWHECECGDKADVAAHSASEWIVDTAATETAEGAKHKECTVCKKVLETATIPATGSSHTHSYGSEWKNDADNHWHECSCGDKKDTSAHTAGEWIIDTPATAETDGSKHKECTVCGYMMTTEAIPATGGEHTHSYGSEWKNDADNHWHECSCGDKKDTSAHTAGEWIIDTPATATTSGSKHKECTVCGYTITTEAIPATGGEHTHIYGSEWKNDADNHWHECSCGDKKDTSAHTAGEWIIDTPSTAETDGSKHKECTVCGYTITTEAIPATGGEHTHSYGSEWKNDADNHWHECSCGDKKDTSAHTAGEWIIDTPATAETDGSKHKECTACGYMMTTEAIPATGIPTEPGKPIVPNSPQTGDNSNIILWIALLFISGGTVIGITVYSKKKKENAE